MRTDLILFGTLALVLSAAHRLTGWAALPHEARTKGPTAGQFLRKAIGVAPPFERAQPIPGFSGLQCIPNGSFVAMPDNGFGSRANSQDFLLGFYNLRPKFKRRADGTSTPGTVQLRSFTAFRDPNGLLENGTGVDLPITADRASYDGSTVAVDATIRGGRLLTGADFDVESIARGTDGSYWVGEEFGPYLLHFAADGTLLDEPVPHPTLKSPSHPDVLAGAARPTLASSRGFEGLAFDGRKRFLYVVPEAAAAGDLRLVELYQFDPKRRAYTGRSFVYRKDGEAILIGDLANVGGNAFVLIERDSLSGADAVVKRLYLIDLDVSEDGVLKKTLLVDLLDIDDPRDLGGDLPGLPPEKFSWPFDSIESVCMRDAHTLVLAIDTNFPSEDTRNPGEPDDSELIELRFAQPVRAYAP